MAGREPAERPSGGILSSTTIAGASGVGVGDKFFSGGVADQPRLVISKLGAVAVMAEAESSDGVTREHGMAQGSAARSRSPLPLQWARQTRRSSACTAAL